jgi:hypothetical protein
MEREINIACDKKMGLWKCVSHWNWHEDLHHVQAVSSHKIMKQVYMIAVEGSSRRVHVQRSIKHFCSVCVVISGSVVSLLGCVFLRSQWDVTTAGEQNEYKLESCWKLLSAGDIFCLVNITFSVNNVLFVQIILYLVFNYTVLYWRKAPIHDGHVPAFGITHAANGLI